MAAQVSRTALAAATWTKVFTAATDCTVNIRFVNRDSLNGVTCSLAIGGDTAPNPPANSDYFETPNVAIEGGGFIENMGISMAAGEVITVFSSAATVSVRCFGR